MVPWAYNGGMDIASTSTARIGRVIEQLFCCECAVTRVPTVQIAAARADCEVVETEKPRRRAEVFGVIETALRAHFARQIEPLCYRTSKYRRTRSLLALCIALNTNKSTRHITSIATSDILVVVIAVTGLNRIPDKDWSFRISRRHRQFLARASRSCAAGRHYQFA